MATAVTMPQLGETVVEGTIIKWLKQEGETIERDEPLFEISTDKVDTEVPSPVRGRIAKILVPEGETVSVGTELAQIEEGDGQAAAPAKAEEEKEEAEAEAPTPEPEEGAPAPEEQAERVAEKQEPPRPEPAAAEPPPQEPQITPPPSEVGAPAAAAAPAPAAEAEPGPRSHILSPLVRRLAEEHDIDLSQVRGTGTGGRITKKDVMAYLEGGAPPAVPAAAAAAPGAAAPAMAPTAVPAAGPREEVRPMSHIRKAIAKHMVESLHSSARAWTLVEVNMENIARVREQAKDAFRAGEGFGLTYMPFVARAVCEALLAFPDVNGEIRGEEMVLKRYVNLGIAVAYEDGLIVPVVKGADEMNLVGLGRAINDVAARARAKKLKPDEVHGGTFTITNPGPYGSIMSVPIINQPQTGILALDTVEKRPVVIDDAIAIRHMVYLSMSWDHRMIDGATAAKFMARLKQNLETWDFGPEVGRSPRSGG
jgi:2-oxoglutarate dehydrogenase E2 component (dihydrolipoamide succinyltransferase)